MKPLSDKIDSKFRYVLLAARRAEQLLRGARPRLESRSKKAARIAMDEVASDRIEWGYGPAVSGAAATSTEHLGATAAVDAEVH